MLVHDAARPLLTEAVIERVLAPLSEGWDGVVPAVALADTVKRVEGERVVETLPRDDLVAVQTPQAFLADTLRRAVGGDVSSATDCAALVEAQGGRVKVVEGDSRLLKITDADDLALVESCSSTTTTSLPDHPPTPHSTSLPPLPPLPHH